MPDSTRAIAQIRSFNRFYTHILGLLDQHILDSDFSLTEARVLLELIKAKHGKAEDLGAKLNIDRSYLSRILKRLEEKNLVTRTPSPQDSRASDLQATDAAKLALDELSLRSDAQVQSLIRGLSESEVSDVLCAMALIREKLSQAAFPVVIRGYRDGDAAYVIRRHEELYRHEYQMSGDFADYVARGVKKLTENLDPAKECLLIPEIDGRQMGSIAIGRADSQTAQLRYFLLEPEARGYGLGLRLVATALDFARNAGYSHIFLETVSVLTTARTIYKRAGFRLVSSKVHSKWGPEMTEERWEMDL